MRPSRSTWSIALWLCEPVDDWLIEQVLVAVELIPAGRVASYGDVAGLVGIGPRQAGAILRHHGVGVPWWRVTNHSGDLPAPLLDRAREHWSAEGIVMKPHGRGCRIADCRVDPVSWAAEWEQVLAR